jgi:hypothetical protein
MSDGEWVDGPLGLDAARNRTVRCERTVLAVVHTVTAGTRLGDVVPLVESDPRIQVVFTRAPSSANAGGVREFLDRLGAVTIPWRQAAAERFDLAVAAWDGGLHELHAPVLTVSHGVGAGKLIPRWEGFGPEAARETAAPDRARLVYRGRVIPSAVIVPTWRQLAQLEKACPEAAEIAVVGGDPSCDRLMASLPLRPEYRRAIGTAGRRLVVISSTWRHGSLLGHGPGLIAGILDSLPASEFQVAAAIHPNAWAYHGRRAICGWLAGAVRRGLVLVPPEDGWQALLAAADLVIGDHGSVTCYGAAAGVPVLLASFPDQDIDSDTPPAQLGRLSRRLQPGELLAPQAEAAMASWRPGASADMLSRVTDLPGRSAAVIRAAMYRLMRLPEPRAEPECRPFAVPEPVILPKSFGGLR